MANAPTGKSQARATDSGRPARARSIARLRCRMCTRRNMKEEARQGMRGAGQRVSVLVVRPVFLFALHFPRTMKALRRSLNSDKSNHSHSHSQSQSSATHVSSPSLSQPRPPLTSIPSFARVAPPQKVIKAIKSHKSDVPLILSYEAGDFFYVAGELEGDDRCPEGWYQALSEFRRRVLQGHNC